MGHVSDRHRPAATGGGRGADQLRNGRLVGAVGDRIQDRHGQRLRAADRRRHRRSDPALCARQHKQGIRGPARLPVLHRLSAVSRRDARGDDHGRRLQPVRVPRNCVALSLCPGRPGPKPPGADGGVSVPDHGHHRRHLHRDRHRIALRHDRDPEHGRPQRPHLVGDRGPHPGRGVRLPGGRHFAEAGPVPAASVAAQRLYLRAVGGQRFPRRHRDQGGGLRAAQVPVHGVQCQLRVRRHPAGRHPDDAGHRRHVRRLDGRHLSGKHQANAGLFIRRADRLHDSRDQLRDCDGADRRHPASVQPRHDEGGNVPGAGLHLLPHRLGEARRHGGHRARHAMDHGGVRRRRAGADRRAAHRRVHQQVVPGVGCAGTRLMADRRVGGRELAACGHLCMARGRGGLFQAGAGRPRNRNRGPAVDADSDLGVDRRQHLFRRSHQPHRGCRAQGR